MEGLANEIRFRAMGTACHIAVGGGSPRMLETAMARVHDLERRWSRFQPASEVSRLNRSIGAETSVSPDTIRLVDLAVAAWVATDGAFDPTTHDALIDIGYDRSFGSDGFGVDGGFHHPAPGCTGIEIDSLAGTVRFPLGVRFDPGGIGKGLAADIVTEELVEGVSDRIIVNLGGDVRVGGEPSVIRVDEAGVMATEVVLQDAGLATSTTLRRRWSTDSGAVHHVIDPSTGRSTNSGWTTASAIAGTTWWAEALTKALLVRGPEGGNGASWRLVDADAQIHMGGGFNGFEREVVA